MTIPTPVPTIPVDVVNGGTDPVAIIAVVIAALSLLGTIVAAMWAFIGVRRRSAVPPAGLAEALSDLNDSFNDITATGGRDTSYFLSDDQQNLRSRLDVLAVHIVDDKLNALVGAARVERLDCWSLSNPRFFPKQMDAADRGKAAASRAIERCGELYRDAAGR